MSNQAPQPIVSMIEHNGRLYVATDWQIFVLVGAEFVALKFKPLSDTSGALKKPAVASGQRHTTASPEARGEEKPRGAPLSDTYRPEAK